MADRKLAFKAVFIWQSSLNGRRRRVPYYQTRIASAVPAASNGRVAFQIALEDSDVRFELLDSGSPAHRFAGDRSFMSRGSGS